MSDVRPFHGLEDTRPTLLYVVHALYRIIAGFLPTFGPSFMNIYGSPREFSQIEQYNHYNLEKVVCNLFIENILVCIHIN